ncbi:hypothetical protein FF041_11400 [Streptomyces jumonjinensis]|uniref:DUF4280 domain-containing protein n=2 Tax=Streptomyces jumonjinensis TaxID=1945 RepID=A0A646KF20_STRJU|nr:hypothetical protein [Streptomyces jumonjinensis]
MNSGTAISCPHGGRIAAVSSAPYGVRIDGLPALTASDLFTVSGCPHTVGGVPRPCTAVHWAPEPGGVLIDGSPVLLERTAALCLSAAQAPQGPPAAVQSARGVTCR